MKQKRRSARPDSGAYVLLTFRAALLSCILTAVLVLLLAFTLKWEWIRTEQIHIVNTIIKTLSAGVAGLLCARQIGSRVWLFAGCAGVLYMMLSYVVFSLIERSFSVTAAFASDILMGFVVAASVAALYSLIKNIRTQS